MHKGSKPQFNCKTCGAKFKKEITLNNHYKTKHEEQACKVCNVRFKTSMEILHHVAKEHSKNIIANISVKEKEQHIYENEQNDSKIEDTFDKTTKFKCFQCKDIVSLEDKFNDDLKEDQMCKLCTMTEAYAD